MNLGVETNEVDRPGYIRGSAGQILNSGGLGPCFGVAICDAKFRSAIVGHFIDPELDVTIIDEMLAAARSAVPELVEAVVLVAGASRHIDESDGPGAYKNTRAFIINKLKDFGFHEDQIQKNWNDDVSCGQYIEVDLEDGTCEVHSYDLPSA